MEGFSSKKKLSFGCLEFELKSTRIIIIVLMILTKVEYVCEGHSNDVFLGNRVEKVFKS